MEAAGAPSPLERVQQKLAEARAARERRQQGAEGGAAAAGGAGEAALSSGGVLLPATSAASSANSAPEEVWPAPPSRADGVSARMGRFPPDEAREELQGWGLSNGAPHSSSSGGGRRWGGRSGSGAWATTSEASSSNSPLEEGALMKLPPPRRQRRPQTAKAAADPRPAWNSSVMVKQRALGFQPIGGAPSDGGRRLTARNRVAVGDGFHNLDVAASRQRQLLASQLREVNAAATSNQATVTKLYKNVGVAHSSSFGGRDMRTIKKARRALNRRAHYSPERSLSPDYGGPGSPLQARGDGRGPGLQPPAVAAAGEEVPPAAANGPGRRVRPAPGGGRGAKPLQLRPANLSKNSHVIHLKIPSIVDDRLSSPKGQGEGALHTAAPETAAHIHLSLSSVLEPAGTIGGAGAIGSPALAESRQPAAAAAEGFSTPSEMVFREWTPLQEHRTGASVTTNTGSQTELSYLQSSAERTGVSNLERAGADPEATSPRKLERSLSKHLSFVRSPRPLQDHQSADGVGERRDPRVSSWSRLPPGRAGLAEVGGTASQVSPVASSGASGGDNSSGAEPDYEGGQESGDPPGGGNCRQGAPEAANGYAAGSEAKPPKGEDVAWEIETDEVGQGLAAVCPGIATWSAERLLEELSKGAKMHKHVQWCGGKGSRRFVRLYLRGGLPFLEWDSRKKARTSSTADGGQKNRYSCRVEAFSFDRDAPWTRPHAITVVCSFGELRLRPASPPQYAQWVFGLNVGLWAADLPPEELDLRAVPAVVEWHADARALPADP